MTFAEGVPASSYLTDLAGQSKNCTSRSIEELFDRIFNDLSVEESHRKIELAKSNLKALKDHPKENLSSDQKLSCQIASLQLNRIIEREDDVALSNQDVYYVYLLKEHTTLDLSPEKVHETGLQEVERIEKKIIDLLKQQGIWNQEVSIGVHLKQLNKPGFVTERQLFLILDRAEKKLGSLFPAKPKTLPTIRPGFWPEKKWGAAYSYHSSMDVPDPGIYMNFADPQMLPLSQIETIAVHEGVPGHHYQRSLQMESGNHKLRKSFEYAAYVEGWALYAEMLAYEEGFYSSPFYQIGHLQSELRRAARLVIDTGIHWKRWSREEASAYMAHITGLPDPVVVAEIESCFDTPGKACAYKIGQMKILEIREEEKKRLGDQFDLKEFHGRILNRGVVPLSML